MSTYFLYATIGHTAAGKTTLCKYLLEDGNIVFSYIEEGQIKRDIVGNYSTKDSLNENLRDVAYDIAIGQARDYLDKSDVLIDDSFHRLERRKKLYAMAKAKHNTPEIIWLYCYCPNIKKIEKRIDQRKIAVKKAETQADSMSIYNHIIETFDIPNISEIPLDINGAIIYINTDNNQIERVEFNTTASTLHNRVEELFSRIQLQQKEWREKG